jgi:hypothetical protein
VKSALNRNVEREFDSSRKDMHWGKRKLKRGTNDGDRLGSKRADNREGGEQMSKATAFDTRMVKKLRLLKGGSVPTFVGLGPVLHNKLAVDA